MAHGFVAAGGTRVLLAASMPMRPAVDAGEWSLRGTSPLRWSFWSCRQKLSPFSPSFRVRQFLVGCSESRDCGREGQVGSRKMLKD